jgi:hypothetical protein
MAATCAEQRLHGGALLLGDGDGLRLQALGEGWIGAYYRHRLTEDLGCQYVNGFVLKFASFSTDFCSGALPDRVIAPCESLRCDLTSSPREYESYE